jgi:hypothetical protein
MTIDEALAKCEEPATEDYCEDTGLVEAANMLAAEVRRLQGIILDGTYASAEHMNMSMAQELVRLRELVGDVEVCPGEPHGVAVYRLVGTAAERVVVAELLTEFNRLREESKLFRDASEASELRIVELRRG